MFHVWQLTGLQSNLGILQQILVSLLVKLWVEKVPLLQNLLLAGLNSLKKFQSEIHIFLIGSQIEISLAKPPAFVWCGVLKWISMWQRSCASKNWVGLSSPQSEWVRCLWCGANHHQFWPASENHSSVDTGIEVRRSETKIQSFSIQRTQVHSLS